MINKAVFACCLLVAVLAHKHLGFLGHEGGIGNHHHHRRFRYRHGYGRGIGCSVGVNLGLGVGLGIGHRSRHFTASSGTGLFYKFDRESNIVSVLDAGARPIGSHILPYNPSSCRVLSHRRAVITGTTNGAGILSSVNLSGGAVLNSVAVPLDCRVQIVHEDNVYVSSSEGERTCFSRHNLATLNLIPGTVCVNGEANIVGVLKSSKTLVVTSPAITGYSMIDLNTFESRQMISNTAGVPVYVDQDTMVCMERNNLNRYECSADLGVVSTKQLGFALDSEANIAAYGSLNQAGVGLGSGCRLASMNIDPCNRDVLNIIHRPTNGLLNVHKVDIREFSMQTRQTVTINPSQLGWVDGAEMNTWMSGNTLMLSNSQGDLSSYCMSSGQVYNNGILQAGAVGTFSDRSRSTCGIHSHHHF
ncbi:Myl1 [Acrasis kona]|uniref:Myl1 n=1 Tax=Acrasis kona TaxID=1008807 RepID=A0AAW2ZF23_9EUKA